VSPRRHLPSCPRQPVTTKRTARVWSPDNLRSPSPLGCCSRRRTCSKRSACGSSSAARAPVVDLAIRLLRTTRVRAGTWPQRVDQAGRRSHSGSVGSNMRSTSPTGSPAVETRPKRGSVGSRIRWAASGCARAARAVSPAVGSRMGGLIFGPASISRAAIVARYRNPIIANLARGGRGRPRRGAPDTRTPRGSAPRRRGHRGPAERQRRPKRPRRVQGGRQRPPGRRSHTALRRGQAPRRRSGPSASRSAPGTRRRG